MNAVNHNLDPITDALHRAASDVTLRRGSHVAVVRAATRRQHRRRRAVAAGAVIAVGGGTVLMIQQLTRSTTPTLRSPADGGAPTVESVENGENVEESPPTTVTSADPAVRVESDLVWNVVTPDAASSVAFSGRLVLPGLIVSTAPGRNTGGGSVMWRSDDGITWEQVGGELPVGSLYGNVSFAGDRIYSVGTSSATAAPEPNPLLLAASEDAGSTWSTIPLPVDTNANADLPYVLRAVAMGQAVPIRGGVLVSVNTSIELDTERLGIVNAYSWSADGVLTQADPDCRPENQPSGMGVATTVVLNATTGDVGGCELTTRPWSEYGVPAETIAAMSDHVNRLFTVADDGTITEITGPDITGQLRPVGPGQGTNPIFFATDSLGQMVAWYRYLEDGTWQELDVPAGLHDIQPAGDGLVSTVSNGYTVEVAMSGDGSTWTRTDLSGLYDGASLLNSWQSTTSPSGALTMAVSSTPDLIAAQGGSEVTIGGVTARLDRAGGHVLIVDYATGEPIDPALITDTSVGVSVGDGNGGVRALFPIETLYEDLMRTEPGQAVSWDVVRTLDGVSFSRESIAELLGLTDAEISSIAHISTNGSKVVVAVTLTERDDSGVPKQLVLVGTPRG